MTLKSLLYKALKSGVKTLTEQFKALVGSGEDDWIEALEQSGKTFKNFKKDLLRKFHPDVNNGSDEATEITQTINGWEEPTRYDYFDEGDAWSHKTRDYWRATVSKEEFLETHDLFVKRADQQTRCWANKDTVIFSLYIIQWHSVCIGGDFSTEAYQGQDFEYKAPYPEEYRDGTINEPTTTEDEVILANFAKAWTASIKRRKEADPEFWEYQEEALREAGI